MRKVAYTSDDDALLLKYIATYNPQIKGRLGMKLYERLVENEDQKWSFSSRHSLQSWRERYKNNQPWFDAKILKYQEKHGISVDNPPSTSTAPIGENGAKKRRREVEEEDTDHHAGVVKKMRQGAVSAQGSQPCDSPSHTRSPSADLRNGKKVGAESSCHEEEESAPVIGPDDYTGALPSSGESDEEAGSQSKDRGVSVSARISRPFTPANDAEVKPSQASRRSASPRLVGATATHGELSFSGFSHQQHDISSGAAVTEVSEFVRDSIGAPLQPSQEPTPPHTSAIDSPRSPVSQKQKRIPPSRRKRTIISRDEDDIFGTPPPQAVRASPPPRTRRREAPRLVEGPFRSAYTSHNRLLFPAAPAHELPPPAPGSPSKSASLGQNPNPAAPDDTPVNDTFKPLVNREARRWTLAGNSEIPQIDDRQGDLVRRASVHHIDLRALHFGKSVGTSVGRAISVGYSNTSESSGATTKKWPRRPSRSSTPSNLSESNKKLVLLLGLEAVYSRMAENHKFHIDVVREVAAEQPSLEDTDRVLCNMRLAANREFARSLRQNEAPDSLVECETGESEEEDEDDGISGDEDDDSQSVQPSHGPLHPPTSPVPQGRAMRLALKIPTASPDPSPTRPPDYSPPTPTRARAFRRLERQGRVEEARLREARRVRRSPRSSSAEAIPEADEKMITSYLLRLREGKDGVPLEKPRNISGPDCLGEQDEEDETQEDGGGVGRSIPPGLEEGHANADTRQLQGSEIAEDDKDPANIVYEQEVPDDVPSPARVDDGVIAANARQSPPGNVLTEETGHHGFPLDKKYAEKTTSSLARSALATLSVLDTEWTNGDDELLLDGNLTEHEGLVRRKGLCSVKFRTAHLYSLLLDS